jgi:hypothetical protein
MRVERLIMTLCTLVGAAGLFLFGLHVWNGSAPQRERPSITVRSEVLTIYGGGTGIFMTSTRSSSEE